MNESTSVSLNLQSPNISTVVYAVQNDRLSRHITAQLLDGSAPWTPPAGAGAFIRYLKPDGTAGFYDVDESNDPAIIVSGSVATLTLAEQCTTVPGDVYMQLNFYGTDGSKLTTFCWILRVQKSVLTDATIISSDYYNVLSAQIAAVLDAAAALTGMTASASGLPTGSDPTVTVTGGSGGTPYNLAFSIPAGPVGPANNASGATTYQAGASYSTPPSGTWQSSPPSVNPGEYLWSKTVVTWYDGSPTTYYSVARQGVDGAGSPGTATPLMDGTASVGTSTSFAREDHVHPSDTSRAAASDLYADLIPMSSLDSTKIDAAIDNAQASAVATVNNGFIHLSQTITFSNSAISLLGSPESVFGASLSDIKFMSIVGQGRGLAIIISSTGDLYVYLTTGQAASLSMDAEIYAYVESTPVVSVLSQKTVAGAIRNVGNGWAFINDANHSPQNLSAISVNSSGDIVVNYSFTASKVVSLVVTPDETFASLYSVGASVGLSTATISVYSLSTGQKVDASTISSANGNFWIYGLFEI